MAELLMMLRQQQQAEGEPHNEDSLQDYERASQSDVLDDNAGSDSDTMAPPHTTPPRQPRTASRPSREPFDGDDWCASARGSQSRNGSNRQVTVDVSQAPELRTTSTIAGTALGQTPPAAAIAALQSSMPPPHVVLGAHVPMVQPALHSGAGAFAAGAPMPAGAEGLSKEARLQHIQYHLAAAATYFTDDELRKLRPIAQALNTSNVFSPLLAAPWLASAIVGGSMRPSGMPGASSSAFLDRFLSTGGQSSRDLMGFGAGSDAALSDPPDRDPFAGMLPDSPRAKRQRSEAGVAKQEPSGSLASQRKDAGSGAESPMLRRVGPRKPGPPSSRDKVWELLTEKEKHDIVHETLSAAEGTKLLLVRRAEKLGCNIEDIPEDDDWGIHFKLSECKATSEPLEKPKNCSICLRQQMVFHKHSYYCRRCAQLYRAIHRKKCNVQDEQGIVI